MTSNGMDIVTALHHALIQRLGRERFDLWFGAGVQWCLEGGRLRLLASNLALQRYLQANFRAIVEEVVRAVLGDAIQVEFAIASDLAPSSNESAQPGEGDHKADAPAGDRATNQQPPLARRRRFADLESFVVGQGNRLAAVAAENAVGRPGHMSPLLLCGPTGVGKTHLLQGIWTSTRRSRPTARAVYLAAEQFTNDYVQAVCGSGLPSFRRKYRGVDLLLIDNLQHFSGKRATQVELLHTIDELLREGRQLVLTADRPPSELNELAPELRTRFSGGMVCVVEAPDYETRLGIVAQMALQQGITVPREVQEYLAAAFTNHARELSGALCTLQASSQAWGRPIDLALARTALSEQIRHSNPVVGLAQIEQALCEVLHVEPASLQSADKAKIASDPRMLAMWLARRHTRAALNEIGKYFGRRSHSTVISAQRRVEEWMSKKKTLRMPNGCWPVQDAVRQIEKRLVGG